MAVGILGTGTHLPSRICSNDDLARLIDVTDGWIVAQSGIHERRLAGPGESTSDLAAGPGRRPCSTPGSTPNGSA